MNDRNPFRVAGSRDLPRRRLIDSRPGEWLLFAVLALLLGPALLVIGFHAARVEAGRASSEPGWRAELATHVLVAAYWFAGGCFFIFC